MRERWKEPDGFKWGTFKNDDGASLRYGSVSPKNKEDIKGTMVLLPGFRETAEKYFETIHDFVDKGYSVWIMDWRGQGGSERYLANEPQKAHSEGFDAQIRDLGHFVDKIIKIEKDKPLIANAHSMGAHLTLRYLKDNPNTFDGAILNAPMLDINTGALPKHVSRLLAKHATKGNNGTKYIPGGKNWEESPFKNNKLTTSPTRFKLSEGIYRNNPHLQIGDATYGWVNEAYNSMDILEDEKVLKSITTPILMATPEQDDIVGVPAQHRAAKLMPKCEQIVIKGVKHEIWMEGDDVRNDWLKKCDKFLKVFSNKKKLARQFDSSAKKDSNKPPKDIRDILKYPKPPKPKL